MDYEFSKDRNKTFFACTVFVWFIPNACIKMLRKIKKNENIIRCTTLSLNVEYAGTVIF
jgi:hypothetical protein